MSIIALAAGIGGTIGAIGFGWPGAAGGAVLGIVVLVVFVLIRYRGHQ